MKRKIYEIFILFALFFLFIVLFLCSKKSIYEYKVLNIKSADEFYLDFNSNNIADENELVKLKGVHSFSSIKNKESEFWADVLNLPLDEYLKNGYLSYCWAKKNLEGKVFKVKNTKECGEKNYICEIELEFNGVNLSAFLLENGLAHLSGNVNGAENYLRYSFLQIKENIKKLNTLDFVVLNLKTNVIHKIMCEHVKKLNSFQIILASRVDSYKFCKICHEAISQKYLIPKSKFKYLKSQYRKFDNLELYLINPLEFKKPDKKCSTDVCKRIIKEINKAEKTIDIALYGFGEQEEIFRALKEAKNRGVKIRIVFDRAKNSENIYPLTDKVAMEFDAVFDEVNSLMHNKFLIFDEKLVMSGSANISSTGTGGYNANNIIFIHNPKVVKRFLFEFNQMYYKKFSKDKSVVNLNQDDKVKVYFSPKDDILSSVIVPKIESANSSILISAFYFTDWKLVKQLIKANARGVRILVLIDALSAKSFSEQIDTLRKNDIAVIVENWGGKNHEKTIIIDNQTLILGSCNFSKSGFEKNDENILVVSDSKIASFYSDYFLFLFNSIDKKYLNKTPRAESFDSINSCHDGIDNNFDGKVDLQDEGCMKNKYK